MNRQYFTSPFQGGDNPLRIGTVARATIFYLQTDDWWRDRFRGAPSLRDPSIVEAFLNGVMGAARRDSETGRWMSLTIAGRSDIALLRSLRTGKRCRVDVRVLRAHEELGLTKGPSAYPDLPSPAAIAARYSRRRLAA